jgi:hypothetical protein
MPISIGFVLGWLTMLLTLTLVTGNPFRGPTMAPPDVWEQLLRTPGVSLVQEEAPLLPDPNAGDGFTCLSYALGSPAGRPRR